MAADITDEAGDDNTVTYGAGEIVQLTTAVKN
jgi:hypothetical protein